MRDSKCVVVVPIYKIEFSHDEERCIQEYTEVLEGEKFIFICPTDLDRKYYINKFPLFEYESFPNKYFKGIRGYNRLMLSEKFYARFSNYEYMLIAQPDAAIWRKENLISYFISLGNDYYGAPWLPERRIWEWTFVFDKNINKYHLRCAKKRGQGIVMGNGGFSLRRINACKQLIHEHRWRKIYWFAKRNEDIFFGLLGRDGNNKIGFKLADIETGKKFALEYNLKEYIEKGEVPFGVHGWRKYFESYEEMEQYLKMKKVWN